MAYPIAKYFSQAQIARAQSMAVMAVGRHCKVRTSDGVQHGVIDSCAVLPEAGCTGRTLYIRFSVDMLCGVTQRRRNFTLRTLPTE